LLLALLVTQATVYAWTDKAGVEHFTDDLSTIPKGAKVRTTDGADISYVLADEPKAPADTARATAPAPAPVQAPVETGPAAPSAAEQTWRELFRAARNKVIRLEEEIEADRVKVEEVNGLPVSFGFNCGYGGSYGGYLYPGAVRQPPINSTGVVVTAAGQPAPGVSVGATVTGTTVIAPPPLVAPIAPVVGPFVPPFAAPCAFAFSPEFAMIRDRLDRNRRELPRAREELADLERRASYEAVPLHWRR
jgi:hypothetical protein